MTSICLRPALPEDAAILADLGARTFRETFERICSPEDMDAFLTRTYGVPQQRAELEDPSRPGRVLEVDGQPSGFLQLRLGYREPGVAGERPVELQRIYVMKACHGQGCGALFDAGGLEDGHGLGRG
ncbi:GNAT family N-acetyltransferase [Geothrix sp. PMB-07]|uniref:GNAT family N-acetyltransferase n=1 Tax=Geothrix sp. PMB-07 TaxID=3068640 RepID=UPI0027427FF4|nr:hypothetical protein [Geothrix sp. PMB-07]WLT29981.1 hypothetical protein Q9293_09665 [Geothrix sp. PMB-07]